MAVLDAGITPDLMQEDEAALFSAIKKHFNEYGVIPDKESLRGKIAGVLIDQIPSEIPEPLGFYIREVRQRSLSVNVAETLKQCIKSVESSNPDEAIELMQKLVFHNIGVASTHGGGVDIRDTARQRWEEYEHLRDLRLSGNIDGVPFPWDFLNELTFGLHDGDLACLVGRIGVGKSWLILHCVIAAWKSGKSPLLVTTEMSENLLNRRIDGMMSGVSYTDFTHGQLGTAAEEHVKLVTLKEYQDLPPLIVVGSPKIRTPEDLATAIHTYRPDGGVFVDGINRMRAGSNNDRYQRVAEAADGLKAVADGCGVPILGTTHFHRQGGKTAKSSSKGDMEDIGYAYAIAEQATLLFGLMQPNDFKLDNQILVKIMKGREMKHPEGFVVNCNPDTMNFDLIGSWQDGQTVPIQKGPVDVEDEEAPF
jgi:replicative DNA helicase